MSIATTAAWKNIISAGFRNPAHMKVIMELVSTISKTDIAATAVDTYPLTNIASTIDAKDVKYIPVATLEGSWKADGSMYLLSNKVSENDNLPWWSSTAISNAVAVEYSFGTELASFVGLTVVWDNVYNSWPTQLIVVGYGIDGAVKYSYPVNNIQSVRSVLETPMDNVAKVVFNILGWSKPSYRARISEVYFGAILEMTNQDYLMSAKSSNKIDWASGSLPVDTTELVIRNQIYRANVVEGVTGSTDRSSSLTDISRVFNGSNSNSGPVATVETKYWQANGKHWLLSKTVSENGVSSWMSDTPSFPVEIDITYTDPVQVNQFNITWDPDSNSWPSSFRLLGFDGYNNQVFDHTYLGTGYESTIQGDFGTVKYVHLIINGWSQPGWRARITQIETLLTYGNNNIPSEVNNLFDPTLTTGYSKYLAQRQKVSILYGQEDYDGNVLWLPAQTAYLSSWSIPTDAIQVNFKCDTQLSFLTSDFVLGTYTGEPRTLYDLALYVLQNSNLTKEDADTDPWDLSEELKNYTSTAPIPKKATNSILQLIAGAAAFILGTTPETGHVRIRDSVDKTGYTIGAAEQQSTPSVTLDTALKSVDVTVHTYTKDTEVTEAYNGSVVVKGDVKLTIPFNNDSVVVDCSATITGATLKSIIYYSHFAVAEVDAGTSETTVGIVIKGNAIKDSSTSINFYKDETIDSGKEIKVDNPFITNTASAKHVADSIMEFYKNRQQMSISYLGYPELKAGDEVAVYSQYLNSPGIIVESSLDFNGGYKGTLKTRMEV